MSLTIYFDESRVKRWGPPGEAQERIRIGNRLLIGAVVASDGPLLETSLAEQARRLLADPMAWESRPPRPDKKDRRDLFAKEHFHFTHDSLNVRQAALATMLEHSVRAHVLYTHLAWESGMNETDIQTAMYFTLLRNLLRRYAGAHVRLVFENESKMDRIYGQIVQSAIASLDRATKRKARQPRASVEARIGRKPNGGLSAVDYCLGVANLGLQVRHGDAEVPQPAAHELESVARLDRHISHVLNFDTAAHARRFDILRTPSWARHIAGVNSHPTTEKSFSTLITRGPTGLFAYVDSPEALATSIGISSETLMRARKLAAESDSYRFPVAVIRGKTRRFTVPKDELLISVHARLLEHFYPLNEALHPCCVAYVPGRRPMDAAAPHVGGRWIQKLDIADFFPSTSSERVRVTFEMLGASFEVAAALADLTTYNNSLPTGARTSPFLSNLVLADFDYAIAAASESLGVTYSRYADDMIFSANEAFDMTQLVSQKLATLGYRLNLRKTRVRRRGQPLRVAGLTVFEMEGPRLPKRTKKRLRLELFLLGKALAAAQLIELDEDAESELAVRTASTRGLVRYCQSVERDWTDRLVSRFPEASEVIARRTDPNRREAAVAAMVAQIRSTAAPRLTAHWEYIGDPPRMDD